MAAWFPSVALATYTRTAFETELAWVVDPDARTQGEGWLLAGQPDGMIKLDPAVDVELFWLLERLLPVALRAHRQLQPDLLPGGTDHVAALLQMLQTTHQSLWRLRSRNELRSAEVGLFNEGMRGRFPALYECCAFFRQLDMEGHWPTWIGQVMVVRDGTARALREEMVRVHFDAEDWWEQIDSAR